MIIIYHFSHRKITENALIILSGLAAAIILSVLFLIVGLVFVNGLPSLTWYFISTPENATPGLGQGILNAIIGTIMISLCATVVAAPFGLGTAIYMTRYAPDNGVTRAFRFLIEVLSGTPSIVVGVFGFIVFVYYIKPITGGFSLIAGALALAILIMPVIERAIEEAIRTVSPDIEEGSYALGANKWQTLRMTTLPAAFLGILTGFTLGFGRAAEESAVVILTAGYTQYMPELAIKANANLAGGVKIYPLQDQVATLPYAVYHAFQNSNVVAPSSGFAAAFVLVVIVFSINIMGKFVLTWGVNRGKGGIPFWKTLTCRFSLSAATGEKPDRPGTKTITNTDKTLPKLSWRERLFGSGTLISSRLPTNRLLTRKTDNAHPVAENDRTRTTVRWPVIVTKEEPKNRGKDTEKKELLNVLQQKASGNTSHSISQHIASAGTKFRHLWLKLHRPSPAPNSFPPKEHLPAREKERKQELRESLGAFGKTFFLTIIPFTIIAGILAILSFVVPKFGTGISFGPGGFSAVLIFTLILGGICSLVALFLLRGSLLFLIHKKKNRLLGSRNGAYFAVGVGICLVIAGAFLFSAHAFQLADTANGGEESGLFGFLKDQFALSGLGNGQNTTTQQPMNRTEQLEALIAAEGNSESGASTTPAADTTPTVVPITTVPVSPAGAAVTPSVPLKDALSLRESYQYGNANRRCIATVYTQTVLPFYFWWLIDYNRFVQETPGPGNKTLVVFLRIENTGNTSALVPSADAVVVTYKGTTYTHQPYFNTSYLSDWQTDYYSTHLDKLPYQWIREIGQKKRDYGYLTGYNIFGQNLTRIDTTSDVPNPGFDINGKGFFIQPGSSNAIDGYLIYNVPDAVAADLKNAYVQVAFNSISSTRWRLGT